jgi:hypothetical protein
MRSVQLVFTLTNFSSGISKLPKAVTAAFTEIAGFTVLSPWR